MVGVSVTLFLISWFGFQWVKHVFGTVNDFFIVNQKLNNMCEFFILREHFWTSDTLNPGLIAGGREVNIHYETFSLCCRWANHVDENFVNFIFRWGSTVQNLIWNFNLKWCSPFLQFFRFLFCLLTFCSRLSTFFFCFGFILVVLGITTLYS